MNYELYSDVILLGDIPEEGLYAGDIGTVEQHNVEGLETGYSVEFFDMLGNTVAVVTLPGSSLRAPTRADRHIGSPCLNAPTARAVFKPLVSPQSYLWKRSGEVVSWRSTSS